ncbi:hypothetical protein LPB136_04485 [Tenacibaculum todarodis]|uniref:HTH luxR-type domain-containing protein n=1 Tax=Tenacibaculum todarodis TaxID=1850252 RepID=A0A1L3JHW5_9FLAO|nr:hypothetical protein [Tenacibaculum todarodis]APG64663.1 hypothetical protein LPB136_04485 [Tenacibaculum todarodis]
MTKFAILKITLNCYLFLFVFVSFGQKKGAINYYKFIDSAEVYIEEQPKISEKFLKLIPEPITTSIEGRLAQYYQLKGLISDKKNEDVKEFQYFLLAQKYAKLEKENDIAGMVSLELFYNTYIIKKDSSAFKYLTEAKKYYTLNNNINGLAEVNQMYAYVALFNKNYTKSNQLILEKLESHKSIKEDQYYYMYALFMLTSNYTHLEDFNQANKYFDKLKALKNNSTISPSLHAAHIVTSNICMAEVYLKQQKIDTALTYLKEAALLRKYMNVSDTEHYFKLYTDYYSKIGDVDKKVNYVDSLRIFNQGEINKNVDAGLDLNKILITSEKQLVHETKTKHQYRVLFWVLIISLIGVLIFIGLRYKKIKIKIKEFTQGKKDFSYLKTNHDKLKVKVKGLEDYIIDVKKEIKNISIISDTSQQRDRIKELYKDLHLNSSTVLDKSKNHLELVNDLNIDFFNTLNEKHPELDDSEVIICYYLHIGFKNKEIAVFLNKSLRSIESKRFRIGKKLQLKEKEINLLEYLKPIGLNTKKTI